MFAVENALMNPSTFFDWPFFILLFGVGIASVSVAHLQTAYARLEYLPSWLHTSNAASLIVAWINVRLAWADLILGIYGFLILPWYTVLICMAADLIVGGTFLWRVFESSYPTFWRIYCIAYFICDRGYRYNLVLRIR